MMKSKLRAFFWLAIALICLVAGVHQTYSRGIVESYVFFLFTIFALFFFLYHRNRFKNDSSNT
ncbi:MAG: hypothetical protein ACP5PS_01605 [Bacteroidales bacterium]